MKKIKFRFLFIQLIIFVMFDAAIILEHSLLHAGIPHIIGYSNRIDATKANNGRRIIRDSGGNLFVVFMDSLDGRSEIWGTVSTTNGLEWSKPFLIDKCIVLK